MKLERRIAGFLLQADPAERLDFETSRTRMLEAMKAAKAEQSMRYPDQTQAAVQTRCDKMRAKFKTYCHELGEVTYEYSKIMDLLVSSAPEYVALAWGAIKIVLLVQVNYQELKQKVELHMEKIKTSFEIVDHLTAYIPKANLVFAVTKAYELFSRFLAKAVKYYSLNRFSMSSK